MDTQTNLSKFSLINMETGETFPLSYSDKTGQPQKKQPWEEKPRDDHFHKVFLKEFLPAMGMIGNRKSKVAYWILNHLNNDNELKYSYRQIAQKTGVSYQTVAKTVRILKDADFLRRSGRDLIVNPDAIYRGYHVSRLIVRDKYRDADNDKSARLRQLERTIYELTREMNELTRQIALENDD